MGQNKNWNFNEIKFLKNNWGSMPMPDIAKRLKRTTNAIKCKALRIGLKDQKLYMEEISLNQLQEIIYNRGGGQLKYKAERNQIPFKFRKIVNRKIKMVDMEEFWKWLDNNRHALSLHNTDKYSFGYEPEWVEEKRQADKRAHRYEKRRPWSVAEDEKLKMFLKSYVYGYREISYMLKRTEGAIKRRMVDLKIKERPLKADNHNPWKKEEIEIVKNLYLKGYKSCIIAEYVNRSAIAINGILERNNYFKD